MPKFMYILQFVLFGLVGLLQLLISGDFWSQLPTFFWDEIQVIVTANQIEDNPIPGGTRPMGPVHFKIVGSDMSQSYSDYVSERFDFGDAVAKQANFKAGFAPGTKHVAYIAPDRSQISLGHFPRWHGVAFFFQGLIFSSCALLQFWQWRRIERKEKADLMK